METMMRMAVAFIVVVILLVVGGVVTGVSNLKDAVFSPKENAAITEVQDQGNYESASASSANSRRNEPTNEEILDACIGTEYERQANEALSSELIRLSEEYVENNSRYVDMVGLSTEDVINLCDVILGDTTPYPMLKDADDPEHVRFISMQRNSDNTELYRWTFTLDENYELCDAGVIMNDDAYTESLDAEVHRIGIERGSDW